MYFDSDSLSPDPLYRRHGKPAANGGTSLDIYPHELVRISPRQSAVAGWGARLNIFDDRARVEIRGGADGRAELVLDFGTEIEGQLEIQCRTRTLITVCVTFGESIPEAEGWGVQGQHPVPTEYWPLPGAGRHCRKFSSRGFRFIRIAAYDLRKPMTIEKIVVHAWFAFRERRGDFQCSDRLMQRAWQASAYTARLCSRPDAYWDGVKRDRLGWYGDARVTQETADCVFHEPAQAMGMLLKLPAGRWANDIPGFSFDAVAMFRQMILAHGTEIPSIRDAYRRMKAMMEWAMRTQTNARGLLVRSEKLEYFLKMGFVDWARMPVGGRFEELCHVQCKYLEALRNAAEVATWLGYAADARRFADAAAGLAPLLTRMFWRRGRGFVHTLNQVCREWKNPHSDEHYIKTYLDKVRLGPSRPSRHSCAAAVFAGLAATKGMKQDVLRVLNDPRTDTIITGYFQYYQHSARAECGDRAGAILGMRDAVSAQVLFDDSPTVSEYFEPEKKDFRRWSLHGFPKSMCHGWSSGLVPITAKYLLGIRPLAPGYARVAVDPLRDLPWTFDAAIPTPFGRIHVCRDLKGGPVRVSVPKHIDMVHSGGNSLL